MATIKSYTDISQSRRLAEILPPESADYCWGIDDETLHYNSSPYPCAWKDYSCKEYYIPCWSLAMLLRILGDAAANIDEDGYVDAVVCRDISSITLINCDDKFEKTDNLVDACVAMIEKLHEHKML